MRIKNEFQMYLIIYLFFILSIELNLRLEVDTNNLYVNWHWLLCLIFIKFIIFILKEYHKYLPLRKSTEIYIGSYVN